MSLTDLMVKQAKPEEKTYGMSDGNGLMLEVRPNGKKYWIVRYWIERKEKRTSLGSPPEVSLKEARAKNVEIRSSIASGKTLQALKRDGETFAEIAQEFLKIRVYPHQSQKTIEMKETRLKKYILPAFGEMPLKDITSGSILELCRKIEKNGALELTARVKQLIGQIFNYAISTGRADTNPTLALSGALRVQSPKHHASLTEPDKIAVLIRHIEAYPYTVVRCALKFSALTFCRPGEIRNAEWKEIDFDKKEWRIPAAKMKIKHLGRPHVVPLARQTIEVLLELQEITGRGGWLFPSARKDGRPMSENTIRVALRAMGYGNDDMTAHGFRSMASTNLNEQGWPPDAIERQLAHVEGNSVRAAYNYAEYLPERRKMMQAWADWLEGLK